MPYIKLSSFIIFLFFIAIIFSGSYAWDDGSITLAYGKTLSLFGKFSLNGSSEIVEGSSTLSIVFLVALINYFYNLDFYQLIFLGKFNALLFTIMTALFTYKYLLTFIEDLRLRKSIVLLMLLFPMYTAEIMNGMEMTLFSFLLLLLYVGYTKTNFSYVAIAIPLILLTRFESVAYLCLTFSLMFLFNTNERRYFAALVLYTLIIFLFFTVFRLIYFDDFLPNTIWAKMNDPYSPVDTFSSIKKKVSGGIEFFYIFNFLLVGFAFFKFKDLKKQLSFWLVVSFFIFSFVIGRNLGYNGRMLLAVLPFILSYFVAGLYQAKFEIKRTKLIILVAMIFSIGINSPLWFKNLKIMHLGAINQGYIPNFINYNLDTSLGVTPENYKQTGLVVDKIRKILGLDTIVFMVPDVGGLGLCCDKIRVIDIAGLTSKAIAKNDGSIILADSFNLENPDLVETHGVWSKSSKIYTSQYFRDEYTPIIFNGIFLWLKNSHLSVLQNNVQNFTASLYSNGEFLNHLGFIKYGPYFEIDKNYFTSKYNAILVFENQ